MDNSSTDTALQPRTPGALRIGLLVAIPLAVVVAYMPALRGGFIWDDDDYVTENPLLRTGDGLRDIWLAPRRSPQYYPMVFTSFWVERRLWGSGALGYHLVNVLLHATSALLLYRVLRKLEVPGASLAAAVFALHPVEVESVAWITERKNVLSGMLYLLALLSYLEFWPLESSRPRRWGAYGAALVFFIAALLSKTVTCTLPVVLLILAWWKRPRLGWREILPLAPLLVIGGVAALVTARIETIHVGAAGEEWSLSLPGRIVLAARVAAFYIGKDFWPHPLIFFYPRWEIDPRSAQLAYPVALAAILLALFALRKGRVGKAPFAAAAIYLVTLFPAMGFFNVFPMRYSYVADHFQYLASAVVLSGAVAAVCGVWGLIRRKFDAIGRAPVSGILVIALLVVLGGLTYCRSGAYRDAESLWRDTVEKNPSAWAAWTNLGLELAARGHYDEAMQHYRQALRIKPDHAEAHLDIALALEAQGRDEEALVSYREAVRIRPNYTAALIDLSTYFGRRGDLGQAQAYAGRVLELDPRSVTARLNLAMAAAGQGRVDHAMDILREALAIDPWNTALRVALAVQLANSGQREQGVAEAREALRRDPESGLAREVLGKLANPIGPGGGAGSR